MDHLSYRDQTCSTPSWYGLGCLRSTWYTATDIPGSKTINDTSNYKADQTLTRGQQIKSVSVQNIHNLKTRNSSLEWRHICSMTSQIIGSSSVCSAASSNIKENIEALHCWPFVRGPIGPVMRKTFLCYDTAMSTEMGRSDRLSFRRIHMLLRQLFFYQKCPSFLANTVDDTSKLAGLILGLCPVNEIWCYFVTTSLIGWAQT